MIMVTGALLVFESGKEKDVTFDEPSVIPFRCMKHYRKIYKDLYNSLPIEGSGPIKEIKLAYKETKIMAEVVWEK